MDRTRTTQPVSARHSIRETTGSGRRPGGESAELGSPEGRSLGKECAIQPFVGRTRELATLNAACHAPGGDGVFLVEGPAGIGKSRLLSEFANGLEPDRWRTVVVAGTEYDQPTPHYLVLDIADRLGGTESEIGTDTRDSARWIRQRLEATPTLLIIDDAHWADAASMRVLALLIRQRPESARIVLAYREGQFPESLGSALRAPGVASEHLAVPPLSDADARALLPELPAGRCTQVVAAAHGNPLYLRLLAELAPADFDATMRAEDPAAAPADQTALDRTIRAELAHLPARERLVAQAIGVCGGTDDVELLCGTAEVAPAELREAIDDLTRRGWVSVTTGLVSFRHPLVRAAAYRLAGHGWRAAAHARAAQVLRAKDAPVLARARHLEHALGRDELAAGELLCAAEQALGTDPAASARWIAAALDAQPDSGGRADVPARVLLGRALLLSGSAESARENLEPLLPGTAGDPTPEQVEAVLLYARCERILGRVDSARNLLTRLVDRPGSHEHGPARLELAILEIQDNHDAAGAERVRQLFTSEAVHDPAMRAAAVTLRSMGRLNDLDLRAAEADYRVAEREFAQLTDPQLLDGIHAVSALGWLAYFLDDQRTGLTHIERAIRVSRRRGRSFILPELLTVQAYSLAKLGRYADALGAADDAVETAELYAYPGIAPLAGALKLRVLEATSPRADVIQCWRDLNALPRPAVRWWRGAVEAALLELATRLNLDDLPAQQPSPRAPAAPASEDSTLRPGPPGPQPGGPLRGDRALPGLAEPLRDGAADGGRLHPMRAAELSVACLSAVDRGDLDAAETLLAQAEDVAERLGLPGALAAAARARAGYLCARGDLKSAERAAEDSAEAYTRADMPVFRAQALLVAAQIAGQRGDFTTATARIAAARAEFAAAGATELQRAATAVQRRLAGHRTVSGATKLSEREREVAELAAKGLANKEIAAQLYLSPRTIEDHLGRILRKLGLTSRAGIASRLAELAD
ncbi:LuxR C-terminal-related transcriptional regulator [Nocardia sp. NPDC059154]|uniref:helix-turn-helix transcriptional regulator n=2 Tax=unclassified Nocardia TaxID=2637762 RepID=UPI0036C0955B